MIRKFNLTNGVSVVITEELAIKYELDAAVNVVEFVSILASIVSAQECKADELNGGVPLYPFQQDMVEAAACGTIELEELKRRFLGERIELDYDVWGREDD